jgi:L-xylulokinase
MFADALDATIEVTDTEESGALCAAISAGLGVGVYCSLDEATESAVGILRSHEPEPENRDWLAEGDETYIALAKALLPICTCLRIGVRATRGILSHLRSLIVRIHASGSVIL